MHISFVMPAYNSAATIFESINSIINGNYTKGDEIIIVNDGSRDKTRSIVEELAKKYAFVSVINNVHNKGCPESRNIGIDKAKNPLIFNLDSDDVLVSGSVNRLKKYLTINNADIAAFGQIHFFKKTTTDVFRKWICPSGELFLQDFLAGMVVPGGNYLYTKRSWKRIGRYSEFNGRGLHEFWGFSLKQFAYGSKFVVLQNSFYYHRVGHKSLFIRESSGKKNGSAIATEMIIPFLKLINKEDAIYILKEGESGAWFDNLWLRPIHTRSNEIGRKGIVVDCL